MHNHYDVPVAVTHVGIPEIAATLVSISDRADFSRFIVSILFSYHLQMNYTVSCTAQPNSDFSPFFFLFHLSRYRPRRFHHILLLICSQKGIFATTIHIMTNITSFDIDLLVFDGLIASYLSNVILKSP